MEQLRNLFKFIASNAILAILLGLLILGTVGGVAGLVQNSAKSTIAALREKNSALEATVKLKEGELALEKAKATMSAKEAEGWKATANDALAKLGKIEGRLKKVEAELKNMPRPEGPTSVDNVPKDVAGVVGAFTELKLPAIPEVPSHQGADIGFALPVAREVLALTKDGVKYPEALERMDALEEKANILEEKTTVLEDALGAKTAEASSWETAYHTEVKATQAAESIIGDLKEVVGNDKVIIKEKDKVIRTEKVKKWTWGGSGILLGLLIVLL